MSSTLSHRLAKVKASLVLSEHIVRINTRAILVTSLSLSKPLRLIIININIINIVYWGYIGIMENKMETTIVGLYRDYSACLGRGSTVCHFVRSCVRRVGGVETSEPCNAALK